MSISFPVRPVGARFALARLTVALLAVALFGASAAQAAGASSPAPLKLTTTSLPPASIGVGYSASLAATGGVGPYNFQIADGSTPPGTGLFPDGQLTGTPTVPGTYTIVFSVLDREAPTAIATRTLSISVGVVPGVYAANTGANSITEYPLGFGGAVSPVLKIAGAHTGLSAPESLVLDATGKTYVANNAADTVTEYPPGANGQATPMTTITGIASPRALALDSANHLFVASLNGSIHEYATGATGAATPIATIAGQHNPEGLAFDSAGHLWVSEQQTNSVNEYALGGGGSATLIASISGPGSGLSSPQALVFDATGHLTVANAGNGTVTIYAAGNDSSPVATLSTGLQAPVGVDRGADLTVFIGDAGSNSIVEYASGSPVPTFTIAGPATGLNDPVSVAATPPLSILTKRLARPVRGRRYLVNLRATEGATPYRWKLLHGRLPRGLRLRASGAIMGVPRGTPRTYRFTVAVRDSSRPRQKVGRRLTLTLRR